MAFQFQSIAAVAPMVQKQFDVSIASVGVLIGLYFLPGIALAFFGGKIGQKFGDKPTTLAALALMLVGGLIMAVSSEWNAQIAGRLVAGAGGVLLNVQLTKMVTDWFAGREIATAMAVFVNSWPVGIAISLSMLPLIGTFYGIAAVHLAVVVFIALGLLILASSYKAPPSQQAAPRETSVNPDARVIVAVIAAGFIWGVYNIGFAMIFSFGPTLLVENGWSITAAGSAVSLVLWTCVFSIPLGGLLADKTKMPVAIMSTGWIGTAILLIGLSHGAPVIATLVAIGLFCGVPAGAIMSLPGRVLRPETRSVGMGLFYTAYYASMMIGPSIGGWFVKYAGRADPALDFGAAMFLLCLPILWFFYRWCTLRNLANA